MGKLRDLANVNTAKVENFVYIPPKAAFGAARILVKPNLGYAKGHPVTVSMTVLAAVLRGLRRANPAARIVITEGVTTEMKAEAVFQTLGVYDLLDAEMRLADVETLIMRDYENRLPNPVRFATMTAPEYVGDYDCRISVSPFKRTRPDGKSLISASLKNLYGLFPRAVYQGRSPDARGQLHDPSVNEVLKDVYFTVGRFFDGAVVDLTQKYISDDDRPDHGEAVDVGQVVWGDDLLAVDEVACRVAGEPIEDYIAPIRALRDQLNTAE